MKEKTIEKILNNKFNGFLNSITDEKVRDLVSKNTIITGGCIASMLLNEQVNDYDLYFRNTDTALFVSNYYLGKYRENNKDKKLPNVNVRQEKNRVFISIKSVGVESESSNNEEYMFFEQLDPGSPEQDKFIDDALDVVENLKDRRDKKYKYKPIFFTSNAITLSDDIQLIIRFTGEPDEIHKNYDFVHCTNYWTSWGKKLVTHKNALSSLLIKDLVYVGSLYPICSLCRVRKFISRGWTISAGQIFKVCYQLSKLDLDDPKVLYDQLLGVDIAYFLQLIHMLKGAKADNKDIDYIYICELIDKVF